MIQQTRTFKKKVAWSLIVCMLVETVVFPTSAYALTSGPSQPEFQKFTPVATTNMVNPFTGDFQYNLPVLNVPGADGGGYALSLSYDANPSMNTEASWVGNNWTLSPGALSRGKKGLPDDYKGKVKEYNKLQPNWSFSRTDGSGLSLNIGSKNKKGGGSVSAGGSLGLSYNVTNTFNNVRGYGQTHSVSLGGGMNVKNAPVSIGLGTSFNVKGRDVVFSANVSIAPRLLNQKKKSTRRIAVFRKKEWVIETVPDNAKNLKGNLAKSAAAAPKLSIGTAGLFAHTGGSVAASVKPHRSAGQTVGGTFQGLLGPVTASYNRIQNFRLEVAQPEIDYEAYGYMYNPNKIKHNYHYNEGEHIMTDYGIEKNTVYTPRDKIIGIPYNNADYFNAIGEGLAGSYRLHHHEVGHYYPDFLADGVMREIVKIPNVTGGLGVVTNEKAKGIGVVLGATFEFVNESKTKSKRWLQRDNNGDLESTADLYEFDGKYNELVEADNDLNDLPFFRAKNDLGGALLYSDLEEIRNGNPVFPDPDNLDDIVKNFRGGFFGELREGSTIHDGGTQAKNVPNISKYIGKERYTGGNTDPYYKGQASYMEYVRNKELYQSQLGQVNVNEAFEKNPRILRFIDDVPSTTTGMTKINQNGSAGNQDLAEHIAQIRVWNTDGNRYTYGLPVYVRDEASFSYGVDITNQPIDPNNYNTAATPVAHWGNGLNASLEKESIVYPDVAEEKNLEIKLGQELEEWYANNYLMTQITTPDYVDLTNNGPSSDDFGGYTSFDYRRWTRSNDLANEDYHNWYRYRTPYTGLNYSKNEHAKLNDDMGSVSSGMRENYYLNAIETKSHIAIFITNKTKASEDFDFDFDVNNELQNTIFDGSGEERLDGLGQLFETNNPSDINGNSSNTPVVVGQEDALNHKDAKGKEQQVEKLERIVLFAKSDLSKPLVTTHFEYDYSSWKNVTNNVYGRFGATPVLDANGADNSGKLTLKKVWFEHQGVKSYKVSPYEFEYQYKKTTGADRFDDVVQSRYQHLFGPSGDWPQYSDAAEKPLFNSEATDRWGNLAYKGEERNRNYMDWLYQGNYDPTVDYDPAAWMLKQIKLPSGGEIHIQYEEKTYQKVQDKQALGMVSIVASLSNDDAVSLPNISGEPQNKFYLNLEEMGLEALSPIEKLEAEKRLVDNIRELYMKKKDVTHNSATSNYYYEPIKVLPTAQENRIYFKFKYQLENGNIESEEYISGYAVVRKVGRDGNGVYLSIGNALNEPFFAERKDIPRQICYDYVTNVNHKNNGFEYQEVTDNVSKAYPMFYTDPNGSALTSYDAFKALVASGGLNGSDFGLQDQFDKMDQTFGAKSYPEYADACKHLNFEQSYIRVPLSNPKRGGGVRVKRVLMYDEGMDSETGDAQLFGTEYDYVKEDGTCSGVATNEPLEGREENALIDFEKRKQQDFFPKIFAGVDREEGETPYGEFNLPPPMVNYSRVVLSNVNINGANNETTKKQSGGFTVKEFITYEDYPSKMYFNPEEHDNSILAGSESVRQTLLGGKSPQGYDKRLNYRRGAAVPLSLGIFNYSMDYRWLAQSFMFIQTNMNGQVHAEATYGGNYDRLYFSDRDTYFGTNPDADIALTSRMEYEYYQPGEKVPTLSFDKSQGEYVMKERYLGLEDDVTMAMQSIYEENTSSSMDLSLLISYYGAGFDLAPGFGFNFTFGEKGMARHMTNRTLYFPAIVKSVTTTMNKATSTVEHLAFSELTGSPILTKTTDGYDRTVIADYSLDPANPKTALHSGAIYNWNLPAAWYYESMGQKAQNENNTNQLTASVGSVVSYGDDGNPLGDPLGIDSWTTNPKNILAASAMTLKNGDWFDVNATDPIIAEYTEGVTNPNIPLWTTNLNELFRVHKVYTYNPKTSASSANGGVDKKTYTSGTFDDFEMFNWATPNTIKWTAVSEVTKYSPNGYSLEELDLISDIPSTAKYGYHKFLSTAVAQNAEYNSIGFESFEDELFADPTNTHPNLVIGGHAGKNALEINTTTTDVINNIIISNRVLDPTLGNDFLVRLWVKNELVGRKTKIDYTKDVVSVQLTNTSGVIATASNETKIAQVGEWVLMGYEFDLSTAGVAANTKCALSLTSLAKDVSGNSISIIVDDVRIQPVNAEMATHVYDSKSFKLLATFGAEHFGSFYQYNDEGGLVRTLVETERGMKVIQETQGNTPTTHQVK